VYFHGMKLRLAPAQKKPARTELLAAFAVDGRKPEPAPALASAVRAAHATGDLATGFRKTSVFHQGGKGGPARLLFVGLGKTKELSAERLRRAAAVAQSRAEEIGVASFQLWVAGDDHDGVRAEAAGRAIAEGLILGAYRYAPPAKSKAKPRQAQRADVVYTGRERKAFAEGFRVGTIGAQATVFARDIENLPGNLCTPRDLAAHGRKLAAAPRLRVKILDVAQMQRLKMGALLGVARGSAEPPRLVVLDWRPASPRRTVCVVGKGLTFDSGGISIKPSKGMDEMRYDMCGGGAVLGLFRALRDGVLRGGRTRIVGIVVAAENMPDAAAQKPGDVVTACDGTTIEVLNTDAEGRLVLADAIAWAKKTYDPDLMVDLATLTGAVIVALGHEMAGVMGNDQKLIDALIEAGKAADEPLWQLPLWDVHREQLESKFADLANINGASHGNGSTAGGAFLAHFAEGTKWAHIDIAGTAWGQRARDYYRTGASGTAVRTLIQWALSLG
jgi:leucyl aminopeptidase